MVHTDVDLYHQDTPCAGSLPQIPKKPWRLAGLELPVKGRYRDLYAEVSANSHAQRCDLDKEGDLELCVTQLIPAALADSAPS